ncbi:MAG TPA: hypothetical protein PKX37_10745 [Flexilinea sp.]|jgi:hypothetical protein|nr:hypothetical protein [Flexilinea sp.]
MSDIYSLARQYLTPVEIELCFFEAFKKLDEKDAEAIEIAIADVRRFTRNIGDKSGLELMAKIGIAMADPFTCDGSPR